MTNASCPSSATFSCWPLGGWERTHRTAPGSKPLTRQPAVGCWDDPTPLRVCVVLCFKPSCQCSRAHIFWAPAHPCRLLVIPYGGSTSVPHAALYYAATGVAGFTGAQRAGSGRGKLAGAGGGGACSPPPAPPQPDPWPPNNPDPIPSPPPPVAILLCPLCPQWSSARPPWRRCFRRRSLSMRVRRGRQ
jgi:hypothetical protein